MLEESLRLLFLTPEMWLTHGIIRQIFKKEEKVKVQILHLIFELSSLKNRV